MKKSLVVFFSCLFTVFPLVACGKLPENSNVPGTTTGKTTENDPYAEYDWTTFEEDTSVRLLNWEGRLWNTLSKVDYTQSDLSGDKVENAIYGRNRLVEERMNVTLKVVESANTLNDYRIVISGGDQLYDAVFLKNYDIPTCISEGTLANLYAIPELDLSRDWWSPQFNSNLVFDGRLYMAATSLHLMSFEQTIATYFNRVIYQNHGYDNTLYEVVQSGKWTFETMYRYMTELSNLNGDETYNETGKSIFGCATFGDWLGVLSSNVGSVIALDKDGQPTYIGPSGVSEYFDKIYEWFTPEGMQIGKSDNYDMMFHDRCAVFSLISFGNARVFRDMEDQYGILPSPKFTESADYRSPMGASLILVVPAGSTTTGKTALVLDALSYVSYTSVYPVYYESLCYGGRTNPEDIAMIEIIEKSRWADLGLTYGLSYGIMTSVANDILGIGDGSNGTHRNTLIQRDSWQGGAVAAVVAKLRSDGKDGYGH